MSGTNVVLSEREKRNAERAYDAARQGMVLLKNTNHVLPIARSGMAALMGLGAVRTVRGGTGSGDPFNGGLSGGGASDVDQSPRYHINILDAFENNGYEVPTAQTLRSYAVGYDESKKIKPANPMQTFAYPEMELDDAELVAIANQCDTAIYVLSRNSGEGADRRMTAQIQVNGENHEIGDYLLCQREISNLKKIKSTFEKTVLVLNIGGVVDLSPVLEIGIDAILLMGQAGQEGGRAVVDVLNGTITPSGKLTATWAARYADYPASETFAGNDGNVELEKYEEGIYVGYRYFDGFGIKPLYEFGYGISYTDFDINFDKAELSDGLINISATVKNIGSCVGREVVQVYFSAPESELEMPVQELISFKKTTDIRAGGEQQFMISFPVTDLASFDEKREAYILSKGNFTFYIGNSSRNTKAAFELNVPETIVTNRVRTEYPLNTELLELSRRNKQAYMPAKNGDCPVVNLDPSCIATKDSRSEFYNESITTYTTDPEYKPVMPYEKVELVEKRDITLMDVLNNNAKLEDLVAQMTGEQLAALNCGTGWGVQDDNNPIVGGSSESVPGAAGETTHILEEQFGIPSMIVADGPGGIRIAQEFEATDVQTGGKKTVRHYCTAWPVGTQLAQSFDIDLMEKIGEGFAEELEEFGIAIVLGPGMNIMRDPLCGRNFEYYAEDPRLTGELAAAITKGIQSRPGIGACVKHYAANNQESNRFNVDTWVSQRALREIYIKGFEIVVTEAQPMSIMTSYNLINGVHTADSYDLCTDIARGEWGFKGLIMTDWNGGSSMPSKPMHSGNDLIMPGGFMRIHNILLSLEMQIPTFDNRGQIQMFNSPPFPLYEAIWNSFTLDANGEDIITADIDDEYKAEVVDGMILVGNEPIYTKTNGFAELIKSGRDFKPFAAPLTTDMASISEDGKQIIYRGVMDKTRYLCIGDLQRCAINNLKVIMRSIAMKKLYPSVELMCWR